MSLPDFSWIKSAGDRVDSRMVALETRLARIAANTERGRYLPDLQFQAFSVKAQNWGPTTPAQGAPNGNMIVEPQMNAVYVTGIWYGADNAQSIAFGSGQSALDASFFPASIATDGTPGLISLAASGGSNMGAGRPNWLFRLDPGMGLMVWLKTDNVRVGGYVQWFAGDVHTETPADLSGDAPS